MKLNCIFDCKSLKTSVGLIYAVYQWLLLENDIYNVTKRIWQEYAPFGEVAVDHTLNSDLMAPTALVLLVEFSPWATLVVYEQLCNLVFQ